MGLHTMTDHSISEKIKYNVHKKELDFFFYLQI